MNCSVPSVSPRSRQPAWTEKSTPPTQRVQPTRYRARLTRERFPDVLHSRVPEEVADRRGLVLQLGHRAFHAVLDAFVIG